MTQKLLKEPELSIVLSEFNRGDAEKLESKRIECIPNFIADPCPQFESYIRPQREARYRARQKVFSRVNLTASESNGAGESPQRFRVLFLSLCCRSKGLFDAIEAVALVNRKLTQEHSPLRVQLDIAGQFWHDAEKGEFDLRVQQPDLLNTSTKSGRQPEPLVLYHGFVTGNQKQSLLCGSDCFCFPTYYPAESFGLVLIEAMAFGLPIIATNWRMIPEILPPRYGGIVQPRSPATIASVLEAFLYEKPNDDLRAHFLSFYTARHCMEKIRRALKAMDSSGRDGLSAMSQFGCSGGR